MIAFMFYINGYVKKINGVDNSIAAEYDPRKYEGLLLDKKALSNNKYLYLVDSSNLNHTDFRYHASNIFRGEEGFIPYLDGEDGVSSIHHALKIMLLRDFIRNKKIVYLLEPTQYIDGDTYKNVPKKFSALHAYEFVFDAEIDKNFKIKIVKSLLKSQKGFGDPILICLLRNATKKHPNQMVHHLIEPLGYGMLAALKQIDRFNAYQLMVEHYPRITKTIHKDCLNWTRLMIQAQKDGEKACKTNPFSIDDSEYNENIKPRLSIFQNQWKDWIYINRGENNNFQLLLDAFKKLNLKPLIIIEPVNGFWCDYAGLPKKVRQQFYIQAKEMIQKAGFQYVDFSDHEYDKYFMRDTKHIGWKGWVYLDQAMDRFYHQ
jgi:D-alanine transfer protein